MDPEIYFSNEDAHDEDGMILEAVSRVREVLVAYNSLRGSDSQPVQEDIADFLADLRHYCDSEGIEFFDVLTASENYYLEERR